MNIMQRFEIPAKRKQEGLFGFELEVEGLPRDTVPIDGNWFEDYDEGSLRDGGFEFVLKKPLSFLKTCTAIKGLTKAIADTGNVPVFSARTSCHVHVNCQESEEKQVVSMWALSLIAEPILSLWCGKLREGNNFCLRGIDAENSITKCSKSMSQGRPLVFGNGERYAFTNTASLATFGSLEYRGMEGTLDFGILSKWLKVLERLKKTSHQYKDAYEMLQDIREQGVHDFLFENGLLLEEMIVHEEYQERVKLCEYVLAALSVAAGRSAPMNKKDAWFIRKDMDIEAAFAGNPFR